jgi:DNA-binding response OmpR family regulator
VAAGRQWASVGQSVADMPERPVVIILAARDTRNNVIDSPDAGADDYLTEPFESKELLATAALRGRREDECRFIVIAVVCVR